MLIGRFFNLHTLQSNAVVAWGRESKYVHHSLEISYTVIRFVSISAKLGICIVVGLNGTLVEAKILTFKCPMCVFQRVPYRPTTVQISNLALIETKRITVYMGRINSCVWFWGLFCYIVYKITRKTASRKIILVYNILIVSKTTIG